jgi:hypothetical protein
MHECAQSLRARRKNNVHVIRQYAKRVQFRAMHVSRHHQIIDDRAWNVSDRAPWDSPTRIRRDVEHAVLHTVVL